jgi:hypothetical protein
MTTETDSDTGRQSLLDTALERVRERYVEEHGTEPPEELMEAARKRVLRELAKEGRNEHRDVYDALADE